MTKAALSTTPETDAFYDKLVNAVPEDERTGYLQDIPGSASELLLFASRLERQRNELLRAIQPILAEYAKRDPIGDSDLYDEQPVHITVTLGDLRRLARIRT